MRGRGSLRNGAAAAWHGGGGGDSPQTAGRARRGHAAAVLPRTPAGAAARECAGGAAARHSLRLNAKVSHGRGCPPFCVPPYRALSGPRPLWDARARAARGASLPQRLRAGGVCQTRIARADFAVARRGAPADPEKNPPRIARCGFGGQFFGGTAGAIMRFVEASANAAGGPRPRVYD